MQTLQIFPEDQFHGDKLNMLFCLKSLQFIKWKNINFHNFEDTRKRLKKGGF